MQKLSFNEAIFYAFWYWDQIYLLLFIIIMLPPHESIFCIRTRIYSSSLFLEGTALTALGGYPGHPLWREWLSATDQMAGGPHGCLLIQPFVCVCVCVFLIYIGFVNPFNCSLSLYKPLIHTKSSRLSTNKSTLSFMTVVYEWVVKQILIYL